MNITVVVSSTDSFEDCWDPFFSLFATYWPGCSYPIVLNTDTKDYRHPRLDIRVHRSGGGPSRLPWGESLKRCLEVIDTDFVLYLQEDFFLEAPVDVTKLESIVTMMLRHDLAHVLLTNVGTANQPWHPTEFPNLLEIDRKANYRVSLQAGLWKRQTLLKYLVPDESPWEFERWGSLRARKGDERFYLYHDTSMRELSSSIYPYTLTGVIGGRWNPPVQELFQRHGIQVDFARRGFYEPGIVEKATKRVRRVLRKAYMQLS